MKKTPKYELILFDLDDTLMDYKKSEYEAITKSFAHFNVEFKEAYHLAEYKKYNHAIWVEFENGEITLEKLKVERFRRFLTAVKIDIDPTDFSNAYLYNLSETIYFVEDAEEVFTKIAKKYRVSFITNGISIVQNKRVRRSGFYDKIEHLIISEEVGSQKPHSEIFEITMKKHNIPPEDYRKVLIIGDNINSDIKGGYNFGIDTCWFNYRNTLNKTEIKPTYKIDSLKELAQLLL